MELDSRFPAKRELQPPLPGLHGPHYLLRCQVPHVAVCRGQAAVAQLVLDDVQGSAFCGKLEGVGVPKSVGMHPLVDPGAGPSA